MPNITIGFSTGSSIVSRIIRWFIRSKASHAFVAFDDRMLGRRIIMESSLYGYKLTQHERWNKKNKIIAEFTCKKRLGKSVKYMAGELGKDYDFWSAFGLAARRWFGKWYRNPFRNPKKLHCSEAMVLFLQQVNLALDLDPESTTPEDLLQYCLQNDNFEEV